MTELPEDLSPALREIAERELAAGNAVVSVNRGMWSRSPLVVVFRDRLHFDQIKPRDEITKFENRDTHYDLEAGYICETTRHSISGPL